MISDAAMEHWARLARRGLVVAIIYGNSSAHGWGWTVDIQDSKPRQCFDHPLPGRDIAHCLEIAEREATKRGWIS